VTGLYVYTLGTTTGLAENIIEAASRYAVGNGHGTTANKLWAHSDAPNGQNLYGVLAVAEASGTSGQYDSVYAIDAQLVYDGGHGYNNAAIHVESMAAFPFLAYGIYIEDGTSYNGGEWDSNGFRVATKCTTNTSPAACGVTSSGIVEVAAGTTSLVIDTTYVVTNSTFSFNYTTVERPDEPGCSTAPTNLTSLLPPYVSAITGNTSFTITLPVAPLVNPACIQFTIF